MNTSTAAEVQLLMDAAEPRMREITAALKERFGEMTETAMVGALGREVGAKRKRVLQRRGEVIRFSRWTETGKCRYRWLPRLKVEWRT